MSDEIKLIQWEQLRTYCQKILENCGMPSDEAFIVADSLVEADLKGIESHGVSRMPIYTKRLEEGIVSKKCNLKIVAEHPGCMAIDACNSMGIVVGVRVMEMAMKKAKESGAAFVTVSHSNHFGAAAYFTKMALAEDMIAMAATNAPPNIAPWGGIKPYMGTNPFSAAIPAGKELPIIIDMAVSVVAQAKIIMAARKKEPIPLGWAINKYGEVTTDPEEALEGSVLPIGGPKGSAMAILIDILCGILSGAMFGPYLGNLWHDFSREQNIGHCFLVLDISKFTDVNVFKEKVDKMIRDIKQVPKAKGVEEIFLPGEIEYRKMVERKREGIPMSSIVYQDLKKLGEKWKVSMNI